MRVLITGVAGHLGSRLAQWILDNVPDCEVYGLDDLSCGYIQNVPEEASFNTTPLDGREIQGLRDMDYVFHLAAYAAEGLSPFIRSYNYRNNLLATTSIVNHCINTGVKRLVYTSSMAVYGRGRAPFLESDTCHAIDPYGNAKRASEIDIQIAGEQHGLEYCIIRPHNVYGPGQDIWNKYRNVFGIWMNRTLRGLPMLIYGDGQQTRAFSYIDDCVPCLWAAATSPKAAGQIINLGGPHQVTIDYAARVLADVIGCRASLAYAEPRHEVSDAWCTVQRSIDLLGYEYRTDLEAGLHAMWTWAQAEWAAGRQSLSDMSEHIEVRKGLYDYWK